VENQGRIAYGTGIKDFKVSFAFFVFYDAATRGK
jgi:hypothetical protein